MLQIRKSITWKSSDTGIATVDENGLVKGIKACNATTITVITCDGGHTAACAVIVVETSTPLTGDIGDMALWLFIGLSSALAIPGLLIYKKRQRSDT